MLSPSASAASPPLPLEHAQRLQCARQWRGFLLALGQEFASALSSDDLGRLMARIGSRFAAQHDLGPQESVPALQNAMNRVWESIDWGTVTLDQTPAGIGIEHRFSPLSAAFGERAEWAAGFLQGAYQQWFDAAGADGLRVQLAAPLDGLGSLRLRLASA